MKRIDYEFRKPVQLLDGTNQRMLHCLSNFRTPEQVGGMRDLILSICKVKIDLFRH